MRFFSKIIRKLFAKDWKKILNSWGWIMGYAKKYRHQIAAYTALAVFSTGFSLLGSLISKKLIDTVTGADTGSVGWAAAAYGGLGISRVFLNLITGKIALLMQTRVQNEMQADVFGKMMKSDWESLSDFSAGELLVRVNSDIRTVSGNMLNFFPNAVTAVFGLLGAFVIVWIHDPVMALIALAGAPVTFFTSQYRIARTREFQRENQKLYSEKMTFDQEIFKNVPSIKAFGLIDYFSDKMRSLQKNMLELSLQQYQYQSVSTIVMALTGLAVSYGCYGFAVYRLWQGEITFGTMTLFISMAGALTRSFQSAVHLVPALIEAATGAERLMEVTELPRESFAEEEKAEEIRKNAASDGIFLKAEGLHFQYKDGREVYGNISFDIRSGEVVGLIGPSGKGKTTLLRLLLGLVHPKEGSLLVGNPGGAEMKVSPSSRKLFSYVPQENTVFRGTIAENLRMVKPDAADAELMEALDQACAGSFVRELEKGMDTPVGEEGLGFSEGQKQRIAIARALLADAPVLLLDEATSALDIETEKKVLENIIRKNPGRIILAAAHRPGVLSMCTRIYRVENGCCRQIFGPEK